MDLLHNVWRPVEAVGHHLPDIWRLGEAVVGALPFVWRPVEAVSHHLLDIWRLLEKPSGRLALILASARVRRGRLALLSGDHWRPSAMA